MEQEKEGTKAETTAKAVELSETQPDRKQEELSETELKDVAGGALNDRGYRNGAFALEPDGGVVQKSK